LPGPLSLSILDAIFTLTLISRGAKELNPVMRYYLSHGSEVFITVKYGLTALPMLIILFANEELANSCRIGTGVHFYVFGAFFIGVVSLFLYWIACTARILYK
jgi:hypothetical protein